MIEYILKAKNLVDYLAAMGEPITERDQILKLLRGLGTNYNSIVALLTTCEDDISVHLEHSILLTHKQRLCFQNSRAKNDVIAANITTSQYQNYNKKKNQNRNNFIPNKSGYRHKPSRRSNGG